MQSTEIKEVGRFTTTTSDGRKLVVVEYQQFVRVTFFDNTPPQITPGKRFFKLLDGQHVNPVAGAEYEIAATGEILRRA